MSETLYKATQMSGCDFYTGRVNYAAELGTGNPVRWKPPSGAPRGHMLKDGPETYLSVSAEPGEVLTGGSWPCRLFRVEPHGKVIGHSRMGFKRCCRQLLVVQEVPAHLALGPNGEAVAALTGRAGRITPDEARALAAARAAARAAAWDAARAAARAAARDAARDAARAAARAAAWDAARDAAWDAAWAAAWDAAWAAEALVVRDLISDDQFQILYGPWASVMGVPT